MVVHDFDLIGVAIAPYKANPPLIVDSNAVLTRAVTAQPFQAVSWKRRQSLQVAGRIQHVELAKRRVIDGTKPSAGQTAKKALGLVAPKGLNHSVESITLGV